MSSVSSPVSAILVPAPVTPQIPALAPASVPQNPDSDSSGLLRNYAWHGVQYTDSELEGMESSGHSDSEYYKDY